MPCYVFVKICVCGMAFMERENRLLKEVACDLDLTMSRKQVFKEEETAPTHGKSQMPESPSTSSWGTITHSACACVRAGDLAARCLGIR